MEPNAGRAIHVELDIDALRVELEAEILRDLVRRYGEELWASMPSSEEVRREWLATAIGFSPELAPRASGLAEQARRALGIRESVELYQSPGDAPQAYIARTEGGPLHIRIHDIFLAHPDDAVLLFVMGHEMGHYLAHAPHRLRGPDPRTIYHRFARGRRAGVREVAAAHCRATELTADRIGLLACQDLDGAARTFMILSHGVAGGPEEPYLANCRARVDRLLQRRERGNGDTHPEPAVRAFALWAFAETDVYRALTGRGAGTRPLAELDRLLGRLVGPSESANDEGLPDIDPCLMERAEEGLGVVKERAREAARAGVASLRRAGAELLGDLARGIGREGAEPERAEDPGEPEAGDLEKRFEELEREMARGRTAAPEGAPDDASDLERRFRELEKRMGSG